MMVVELQGMDEVILVKLNQDGSDSEYQVFAIKFALMEVSIQEKVEMIPTCLQEMVEMPLDKLKLDGNELEHLVFEG